MYSNWRNKVEEAAQNADAFASFMNMCSFQLMLSEIAEEVEIGSFSVMDVYDPDSLEDSITSIWIQCPVCGSKTRDKIREDTVLENYPLFCPKCKKESLISAKNLIVEVIKEPDA